jgi:four helix bundle protein
MDRKILEKRLVSFSTDVLKFCRDCEFDSLTNHLLKQIVRSSSSTALNYGEAQSAESRADFAHKLSIVLKELRETYMNLTLIEQGGIGYDKQHIVRLLAENNELIAIFQKSVNTLRKNNK